MYEALPKKVRLAIAEIEGFYGHVTGFYPNDVTITEEYRGNAFWKIEDFKTSDLTTVDRKVIETVLIFFDGENLIVEGIEEVEKNLPDLEYTNSVDDRRAHTALTEIHHVLTVAKNWRP